MNRPLAGLKAVPFLFAALLALVVFAGPAQASGTPNLQLSGGPATSVLYGKDLPVDLTASLGSGQPKGYNLAFRAVLPAGVSYKPGSAGALDGDPTIIANAPTTGQTTLIWANVDDLVANASRTLSFKVVYNTTASAGTPKYDVGDTIPIATGAYISTQPRDETDFDSLGNPIPSSVGPPVVASYTGKAEQSTTSGLTAIKVDKAEPHPEGEIPRGLHDHQTTYTLHVTNNDVNPTNAVSLEDYIPAAEEFLGCSTTTDHTSNAFGTNPGQTEEYPGSGPITVAHPTPAQDCVQPDLVETVQLDPDGAGPLPSGIYTHVKWNSIGNFPASGTKDITYAVAIPLRENTLDWNGSTAGNGTAPADTGIQTANLDNNTGPETTDEQQLLNGAMVAGTYQAPAKPGKAVSDEGTLLRTAEDFAVQKTNNNPGLNQGELTKWTLNYQVSEYRYLNDVQIHDVLPNGLCPLGAKNYEDASDQQAECAADLSHAPSDDYTTNVERGDGAYDITWNKATVPAFTHLKPNDTGTITFWSRTRENYQSNFIDTTPVLSNDAVTNTVPASGTTANSFVRCEGGNPDCTTPAPGTKIWTQWTDGDPVIDATGSGKAASGPSIEKTVAATYPGADCNDLPAASYGKTVPVYGPGDQVCWKLKLVFPSNLDTSSQDVFDILPSNIDYVPGSWQTVPGPGHNTVPVGAIDTSQAGRLRWPIGGGGNDVDAGAQVFEVTFRSTVGSPLGHHSGDVEGNLMKFSYVNTAGNAFTLRDKVDFKLQLPELALIKGIAKINSTVIDDPATAPDNVDHKEVQGGDAVQYRVDVTNDGKADATGARVWDVLPAGIACSDVQLGSISDGGTCNPVSGRIEWSGLAIAQSARKTLTYTVIVPVGVGAGETFTNTAGVVEFRYIANDGTSYQLIPANDVVKDTSLPAANTAKAQDVSDIYTDAATIAKSRTTSVNESGNGANSQATIGENVNYTLTTTIPQGTTLYGSPTVVDNLGARQTYVPGTLSATLNGTPLPTGGLTVGESGNIITVQFPSTYANASNSSDDVLVVTFSAKVLDVAANVRGGSSLPNATTLTYKDEQNRTYTPNASVSTTIVEPKVAVTKTDDANPARVSPGQVVTFNVRASNTANGSSPNTNISTAHDLVVVDTLPAGTDPVLPISSGGVWNAGARTITWDKTTTPALAAVAPGTSVNLGYQVTVESPGVVGRQYVNTVTETAKSLDGSISGVRTPSSTSSTAGDYDDSTNDTLKTVLPTISKDTAPDKVTVGDKITWHVHVTLPKNLQYYDANVQDTLPDGVDFDSYGAATCTSGCLGGDPAIGNFTAVTNGNPSYSISTGWWLGDLAPSANDRVYDLVINGHVRDKYRVSGGAFKVLDGQTLVNSASLFTDRTDRVSGTPATPPPSFPWDNTVGPVTATNHVVEPKLAIDKSADVDPAHPYVEGNDHVTYSIAVKNNGTSPAYDVVVDDQPDSELTNVVLAAGVSTTTNTNGWTAGSPDMSWTIPGPIAVGDTVTLTYSADVKPSSALHAADQIKNTANINKYFGVPKATRDTDGFIYREYNGPNDTVTLTPDFPKLSLVKTTGAPGNPDIANAQINQPFTWRVVVTNTSHVAVARNVDVKDTLPPNWSYIAGTSVLTPGGTANPAIVSNAGGDQLTWNNVTDLAPGASVTVVFQAKPSLAAATTPGNGVANPHTNTAVSSADDTTGASGNADGPYVSNADTAQAVLRIPNLTIVKTPDNGAATAGSPSSFTIKVTNTDAVATAHNVVVHDVLDAGLSYTAGTATAAPSAGFSETGASGQTIDWKVATLAPGASVTITVPVGVAANVPNTTTLNNVASTHADEVPTDKSDNGSLKVSTKVDLQVTKVSDHDPVVAGTDLVYTMVTKNNGPSDAQASALKDTLPSYLTFVSLDDPGHCSVTGQVIDCAYGTLAPGATRTVHVTVKVDPARIAPIRNDVDVTTTTTETNTANNHDFVVNTVKPVADVSITKKADKASYVGGDLVTYTLVAHNDGPSDAEHVTVDDDIPSDLTFVSVTPGAPTCAESAGHVHCDLGTLAPGADRTVTIVTKAKGTPPAPATNETHKITVFKEEQYVSLQPGETRTIDVTCSSNGIAADGAVQIVDVDQGHGTPADVQVLQASSISLGTYRFVVKNTTSGQAQIRPHVTCLPHDTDPDTQTHPIDVGSLQSLTTGSLAPGRYTFTIPVDSQHHAIAQGIEVLSGNARLVGSEPGSGTWKFTVEVLQTANVKLSLRLLSNNTGPGGSPSHVHPFSFQHVVRTVTIGPGRTNQIRVSCPVGYKGIVGTYDLPAGVVPLGSVPEPINRDFDLYNGNDHAVDVTLDLECISIETGPPLGEVVTVVNTAFVATTTFDNDHANDSDAATVTVGRAVGLPGGDAVTPPTGGDAVTPPSGGDAVTPVAPVSLRFGTVRVVSTGSSAAVPVTCRATTTCSGTVSLSATVASSTRSTKAKTKKIVLGTAKYKVKPGKTVTVTVRISSRYRSLIKSGKVKSVGISAGRTSATTKVVVAKKKKKKKSSKR